MLILPVLLFLAAFFVVPLFIIAFRSTNTFTADTASWWTNYATFFSSFVYMRILVQTLATAVAVTLVCLVLGYPYAYLMSSVKGRTAILLAAAILFPYWSNVLVRTYAWTVILQDSGIINSALKDAGLISSPLSLIRTWLGVIIGMTHVLLPYMVLPLYAVMRRIDPDYLNAAGSLGAPPRIAFLRVFLPLSKNGLLAGCLLVFALSVGYYITPALLGGPAQTMLAEHIVTLLGPLRNPGLAYAAAVILLVITLAAATIGTRLVRLQDTLTGQ